MKNRMVIDQSVASPEIVLFHVNAPLTKKRTSHFKMPLRDNARLNEVGEECKLLLRAIQFFGVEEASVYPYKIQIKLGKAFRLDEVGDHIKARIATACFGVDPIYETETVFLANTKLV
ncbi:MAG: hypothetical protein A3D65_06010 [Candidatus Lloydbacteria bacterium RIFCSPHIGHO2_02_FULL_50_13]|uniref:Uncharacterized protein n=1 Tax=Candidatus Lloydbacteria bacterium RIFCSPHIGHO2_02_FULL_50_13 TaxID=1798661 RepID=A0A1G2D1I1_9BACT|nr:MAG: hypothetical protein A3D65_06010 [Candidatus Lloydbacteria bacterium RIFCSPHIGHO2_02_FULL_50_13]